MIIDDIKNYFRKKSLKKYSSKVPTGIIPLPDIKSAVACIDQQDPDSDQCKETLMAFFRENGIRGEIYFFDLRKVGSEERLITSIAGTFLKKDINWYDRPSMEKINMLRNSSPDLLISLMPGNSYTLEFIVKCSPAKFKMGRAQMSGDPFDLVITDPSDKVLSQRESFNAMKVYLKMIQRA